MTWAGRFETIASIGTGGMAEVFVGRIRDHGAQLVAIKRAHAHIKQDKRAVDAMIREAQLASRVRHPNVVGVLGVDDIDGDIILVLDYVEGCTLRMLSDRLKSAREFHPREMIRILLDVAAGLHAAHLTGLVHRDVSPSNMLVGSDGISRLADFGIAKAELDGGAGERTSTGILKGKLAYMAPEYILAQSADASSDLFSFAVTAWETLAGARLFYGNSDIETLANIADAKIRPLSSERPDLGMLDGVFQRALARRPEHRHASVEEMASELEVLARGYDLVASHDEVAQLVERAAAPELQERRRILRSDQETMYGPPSARPIPKAPPSEPDPPTQMYVTARRQAFVAPTARRSSVRPGPSTRPPRNEREREIEARREKLALVGALMLLALALGWMWTQLRNDVPIPIHQPIIDAGTSPAMGIVDAAVPGIPNGSSQRGKRPRPRPQ